MRGTENPEMLARYQLSPQQMLFEIMAKIEKKKAKLEERIATMESELLDSLTKKTSTTKEIDVPSYTREIHKLKIQLRDLK